MKTLYLSGDYIIYMSGHYMNTIYISVLYIFGCLNIHYIFDTIIYLIVQYINIIFV